MSSRRSYTILISFFLTLGSVFFFVALVRQLNPELNVKDQLKQIINKYEKGRGGSKISGDFERAEALWQKSVDDRQTMMAELFDRLPDRKIQDFIYPYNFWDLTRPTFYCPFDIERVGKLGDGGKWTCGMSRYEALWPGPSSEGTKENAMIAYSFGVDKDSSFEAALLERTNVEIWGFDYSVEGWASEVGSGNDRAHFAKAAIFKVSNPKSNPPMLAVRDIMKSNKHDFVDIMKMDIEGAEFEALGALMDSAEKEGLKTLPVGQLLIELHVMDSTRYDIPKTVQKMLSWFERLEKLGMRPVWNEHNWIGDVMVGHPQFIEYSFINVEHYTNVLASGT
ncbi:hypothetical protein MBLNU230_g7072t1 [Neophaeotheca triangularis]